MSIQRIGLIAGNGKFPILFAQAARRQGIKVSAAAIRGDTSCFLKPLVAKLSWFKVGELGKLFAFFKEEGIKKVIMAGQVNPKNLFDRDIELDEQFQHLLQALENRKADTIFLALATELKRYDMELIDSTFLLEAYLAPKGTLTKRGPTQQELEDISFGCEIAKSMGGLDVGQTVVVKEKAIVAIEAMEGTDLCIQRAGEISSPYGGKSNMVVVKVSKIKQDLRFDVPVIGLKTIEVMNTAGARILAFEADKTLLFDKNYFLHLADKYQISVVGVTEKEIANCKK